MTSWCRANILAEPPVSVVDKNLDKRGPRKVAEAYLQYLYSPEAQEIAAKHFYRPADKAVYAKSASHFPKLNLFMVKDVYGNWEKNPGYPPGRRRLVRPALSEMSAVGESRPPFSRARTWTGWTLLPL